VRDEAKAPTAATAAAAKNNEQKIRRHRDGINVDVGVFMSFSLGFCYKSRQNKADFPSER
jgi:hypothetical protein